MHSPDDRDQGRGGEHAVDVIEEHIQSFSNYLFGLRKAEGTIKQYVCDVRGWWAWWGRPVSSFDLEAWDAWTSWQAEQGWKGKTIQMHQMGVRRFFRFLKRRKLFQGPSPCEAENGAEGVEIAERYPEVLTQDEVEQMRRIPNRARTKALFALLYDCGLRNSEARKLPLSHVQPDYIKVIGKRNRERKVPLVPATREVLEAWIAERPMGSEWLFPTAAGNPIGMESMCKMVKYWAKASKVQKRVTAHTFRHSIATHLIERGMPIEQVQEFMGHKSIETTRVYVHIAQQLLKQGIERFHPLNKSSSKAYVSH
jgi:integrase/recombinase XerD